MRQHAALLVKQFKKERHTGCPGAYRRGDDGVYEDAAGQRYYVKETESVAHARNEYLAAMLYQLAGAPTLCYLHSSDPCCIVTRWCELAKKNVQHFSARERAQAQHWFALHCWLANWDAAGFHGDNQAVAVADGRVLTLDSGGALNFRAQGDPKGKAFGKEVHELNTLRQDADNPFAVQLFGAMDDTEVRRSLAVVTGLADRAIEAVILQHHGSEKLVAKMLARKAFMLEW